MPHSAHNHAFLELLKIYPGLLFNLVLRAVGNLKQQAIDEGVQAH